MLSEDILSLAASLGELGGNVPEHVWEQVQGVRANLKALGEQAGHMERNLPLVVLMPQGWASGAGV